MMRSQVLDEIRRLDPVRDHQRIVFLSTCYDFSFDTTRALEFALFRTFCVPSISELLDRTGEFGKRAQKRYDDTDLIVSELMEWGYESDRGRRALRKMNQLNGCFVVARQAAKDAKKDRKGKNQARSLSLRFFFASLTPLCEITSLPTHRLRED
jgi:hypothetical protein